MAFMSIVIKALSMLLFMLQLSLICHLQNFIQSPLVRKYHYGQRLVDLQLLQQKRQQQ